MDGGNSLGAAAMLGLEMPYHSSQQQLLHQQQQNQQQHCNTTGKAYAAAYGGVKQLSTLEDMNVNMEEAAEGTKRGTSSSEVPAWHRMKWTDTMVRLLIVIVHSIGDDVVASSDHHHVHGQTSNKKGNQHQQQQQQQQQKKGKWKSVSQAMMERGYSVSPQQCEDKFNDLNKRYKRVNELLGRGTACRVVENHALLDTLDLNPKAKDEARKLLNSKHLFFREMCAYHNSATASTNAGAPLLSSASLLAPSPALQQQHCLHHPIPMKVIHEDYERHPDGDDDYDHYEDGDFDDLDDDEDEDQDHDDGSRVKKKPRRQQSATSSSPPLSLSLSSTEPAGVSPVQQLRGEMMAVGIGGGGASAEQQRQWLRGRAAELEEQQLGYQCRALELEKQHFKWLRFSTNKEREMERMKLENERRRLDNDRMLLLLRQKELEVIASSGAPPHDLEKAGASLADPNFQQQQHVT